MSTAKRAILVTITLTLACMSGAGSPAIAVAQSPPNIVVLMLDDLPEEASLRLFKRMPRIAELFVDRGIRLTNMHSNDPLCCPGRAGFLTGLYSHHHGVVRNDVHLFDPRETIATALRRSGYFTAIAGKYLNGVGGEGVDLTPPGWDRVAITGNGYRTDWYVGGSFEEHSDDHHTDVLRTKALAFTRATPANKPLFLLLAPYAVHADGRSDTGLPRPANRHVGDPRCKGVPPYGPPSFNEADVSDKPAYIRQAQKLPGTSWPLVKACETLLSVDELLDAIRDELKAQGRLADTLFVLADDNGMGWGAHRLRAKSVPYATHLAGYVRWQGRWGNIARTETGHAQLTDLAPTLCEVAGCHLGPYPTGQDRPDGIGLLHMLDTGVPPARAALLEEHRDDVQHVPPGMPKWWAIRTTNGRWHYVEYQSGERELYELSVDPWELDNVAGQSRYEGVELDLANQLLEFRKD